jgi:hypothetical protein
VSWPVIRESRGLRRRAQHYSGEDRRLSGCRRGPVLVKRAVGRLGVAAVTIGFLAFDTIGFLAFAASGAWWSRRTGSRRDFALDLPPVISCPRHSFQLVERLSDQSRQVSLVVSLIQRSNAILKTAIPASAVRLAAGSLTPHRRSVSAIAEARAASLISSRSRSSAFAAMTV